MTYLTGPVCATLRALTTCRKGATAIEYALIAGLIALVIIGGITALGGSLTGAFGEVAAGF